MGSGPGAGRLLGGSRSPCSRLDSGHGPGGAGCAQDVLPLHRAWPSGWPCLPKPDILLEAERALGCQEGAVVYGRPPTPRPQGPRPHALRPAPPPARPPMCRLTIPGPCPRPGHAWTPEAWGASPERTQCPPGLLGVSRVSDSWRGNPLVAQVLFRIFGAVRTRCAGQKLAL